MAERMAAVAEVLKPNDMFRDTASEVIAEVDRKELGRLDKAGWYSRFAMLRRMTHTSTWSSARN